MHGKCATLIVNLRSGRTVVRVPEMVAVLSAAGWKTDICLKEYSGKHFHSPNRPPRTVKTW